MIDHVIKKQKSTNDAFEVSSTLGKPCPGWREIVYITKRQNWSLSVKIVTDNSLEFSRLPDFIDFT